MRTVSRLPSLAAFCAVALLSSVACGGLDTKTDDTDATTATTARGPGHGGRGGSGGSETWDGSGWSWSWSFSPFTYYTNYGSTTFVYSTSPFIVGGTGDTGDSGTP